MLFPVKGTTLDYSENQESPPYDGYPQKQEAAYEPGVSGMMTRPPPLRTVQASSTGRHTEGWPGSPVMFQRRANDGRNS